MKKLLEVKQIVQKSTHVKVVISNHSSKSEEKVLFPNSVTTSKTQIL